MTPAELSRFRLAAQRVAGSPFDTPQQVVRWLTCMQSQDLPDALHAIGSRIASRSVSAVRDAFDRGEIVRSWPMRGTLHTVPAEDLGWMLALTAERTLSSSARRRQELGIGERDLDAAADVARAALTPDGLTRGDFLQRLEDAGQSTRDGRGYHLLFALSQLGVICLGPFQDAQQRFVLRETWVPDARHLDREAAVAEWMLRYFRSHGPATLADFRWWTKLPLRDCNPVLGDVRGGLEVLHVDGTEYLMDPETPDRARALGDELDQPVLLAGFDEMVLGYQDRSATVADRHMQHVVPGNNGVFRPTIVVGGTAVATWRPGRRDDEGLRVTSFTKRWPSGLKRLLPDLDAARPA